MESKQKSASKIKPKNLKIQKKTAAPSTKADVERLLHQLEVHQIKLKMQNDELVRSRAETEAALHQYTTLYDFAPAGYFTLTPDGTISQVNLAGADLLGMERSKVTQRRFGLFVSTKLRTTFNTFLKKVFEDHKKETCEILLQKGRSAALWVRIEAEAGGETCRAVITDITKERQWAEDHLQHHHYLLQKISDAVIATDKSLAITSWNTAAEKMYGWKEKEVLGKHLDDLLHTEFLNSSQTEAQQELMAHNIWTGDLFQRRKNNQPIYITSTVSTLEDADGNFIGGVTVNHDITGRKETEQALIESEERYRTLVTGLPVGVLLQGPNAEIIVSNEQAIELLGLTESQLLGKTSIDPSWNVIHEDGRPFPGTTHPVPQAIATRQPVHDVVMGVYRPATQDRIWLLVNADPLLNPDGSVRQVICTFADITERKQMEGALHASEQKNNAILNAIPDLMFRLDREGTYLDFRARMASDLYVSPETIIGQNIHKNLPAELADLIQKNIDNALENGELQIIEYTLPIAPGIHHYEARMAKSGINETVTIVRDITERKQAEAQLRLNNKAIESATEGIIITDYNQPDNPIIFANPAFYKITGYSPEETLGKNCRFMQGKDTDKNMLAEIKQCIEQKKYFEGEILNYKKDGTSFWNFLRLSPIFDDQGNCTHFAGFQTNITERKNSELAKQQAEKALRASEENLAQRNKKLTTLHDLVVNLLNRQSVDEIMQTLLDYSKELMDAPYVSVNLLEGEDILTTRAATANHHWLIGDSSRRGETGHLSWQAVETGKIAALDDYSRWEKSRDVYESLKLRAVAEVPIKREGKTIGVLSISRDKEGYLFNQQDMETASLLAQIAALIIDNAQLYEDAQKEIAERRYAEETLRENQYLIQTYLDNTPGVVFMKDLEGRYLLINREYEKLLKTSNKDAVGKTAYDLFPKAVADQFSANEREIINKGSVHTIEDSLMIDGTQHDYLFTSFPIQNNQGIIRAIGGISMDITERKQIEEQRDDILNRLQNVLDNMPVGCIIIDPDDRISYWNNAAEKMFGYSQDDVIGKVHYNVRLSDDYEKKIKTILDTAVRDHKTIDNINENITKDGRVIICQWNNTPLQNAKGEHIGILSMAQDITENKKAESNLKQSEMRLQTIVQNLPVLINAFDEEGNLLFWNHEAERITGHLSADVIGKSKEEINQIIYEPGYAKKMMKQWEERGNYYRDWEWELISKDGTIKTIAYSNISSLVKVPGWDMWTVGVDVTSRTQAELALNASHDFLNRLIEQVPAGIQIFDTNGTCTNVNRAYLETFGATRTELIGRFNIFKDSYASKDDTQTAAQRALSGETVHLGDFDFNFNHADPRFSSGKGRRTINVTIFPIFNQANQVINFVGLNVDVTERKKTEENLNHQNEFLQLLNDMTHSVMASGDFNTMMNILAKDMAKLLKADECFITRWDEKKERVYPVMATWEIDRSKINYPKGEKNLTTSALEAGDIIIAEDRINSAYTSAVVADQFNTVSAMSIPLIIGNHKLGATIIGYKETHLFTTDEISRARQAGDQVALALWNAQQDFEIQRSLRETQTLADIALALSETERIGLSNVLQLIVTSAQNLVSNAEQTIIHLLDEKEKILTSKAVAGFSDPEGGKRNIRLGEGVAGQVILSGETINIDDINTDPRFVKFGTNPIYQSLLVAPIRSNKLNLGTISIQSSIPYAFTQNDIKLLSQFGTQAAIAIENTNLLESTKQALKEANAIHRVNKGLVASLDPDDLLQDTVELLQKNFDYHYVQVFVADPESGNFIMRAGSGEIGAQLKAGGYQLAPGEGIVGYTAETGAAFFTNNVDNVFSFVRNPLLPDVKSELAIPVKSGKEIIGLLDIHQIPPKYLSQHDLQLVSGIADQLAVALQKADLYESLQISLQQEKAIRNQLMQNERLAVMGRLLATVSHELNNPLQAIQNALFLLKEETGISVEGKQDLDIVLAESERMANLIERLRDTYRPTQSEDFQFTQLNNIVEDVYALISTHLRHKQIVFEFHPDPDLPDIPTLTDQIRQVVLNLLMNAVEAMTHGGKISVATEFIKDLDEIMLTISDTGPGIEENMLPDIFEAFVTNKSSGTGLGLTISYDIVMKHRGRIMAENNSDHGATFKVWLPINNGEIL